MRKALVIGGVIAVMLAIMLSAAGLYTRETLRLTHASTPAICFSAKDRARLVSGWFTPARQDIVVVMAMNFSRGADAHQWWHLRGGLLHLSYRLFWSLDARQREFHRLVATVHPCPPARAVA